MDGVQKSLESYENPQCRYFVQRKKRLCRMTVRPGKQYCGEHEPEPQNMEGEPDTRVPCPLDPKHTCYKSKLEKHLQICNAKQGEMPEYMINNINAPADVLVSPRLPLSQILKDDLIKLIDKVNQLYTKHIDGRIETLSEKEIHRVVVQEFSDPDRTESSKRHLRQASRLLQIMEDEGLVKNSTCYVELGAGKGQLSFYACTSWCLAESNSRSLLIDRAALRHKRDNALRSPLVDRIRGDLAHVALARTPAVERCASVVGFAKHLCGVATDYALRCITSEGVLSKAQGIVLATCCHHRCELAAYIAAEELKKLGISDEEFNIMLSIVSWATCGDGRSREQRTNESDASSNQPGDNTSNTTENTVEISKIGDSVAGMSENGINGVETPINENNGIKNSEQDTEQKISESKDQKLVLPRDYREEVGRRAKALIDWGRVLYLRSKGFDTRLCYYVNSTVSLENVCIIAKKIS